jgi:hypothetical protein
VAEALKPMGFKAQTAKRSSSELPANGSKEFAIFMAV